MVELSHTAVRAFGALEAVLLGSRTAPPIAARIGANPRTARRILRTLVGERYLAERRHGDGRTVAYEPTVRLLAMAAHLASDLALVRDGQHVVDELHQATGLDVYVAIPCYRQVAVIARAVDQAPEL